MVRVVIEDDGLSISSPGGFIEGVNLHNLLTVEPHGRNQTLADALKRIGLAERSGRGIDRIYEGSIIYGRPLPDYSESTSRCVKLYLQRAKADVVFARMIYNEEKRLKRRLSINSLLILSTLQTKKRATLQEIIDVMHISESRVKINLEKLIEDGLVEVSGRTYMLSLKVYRKHQNTIGYVRETGIHYLDYSDQILNFARQQGYVTRENVSALIGISESQAYRILKRLKEDKELTLIGKGRNARYQVVK